MGRGFLSELYLSSETRASNQSSFDLQQVKPFSESVDMMALKQSLSVAGGILEAKQRTSRSKIFVIVLLSNFVHVEAKVFDPQCQKTKDVRKPFERTRDRLMSVSIVCMSSCSNLNAIGLMNDGPSWR